MVFMASVTGSLVSLTAFCAAVELGFQPICRFADLPIRIVGAADRGFFVRHTAPHPLASALYRTAANTQCLAEPANPAAEDPKRRAPQNVRTTKG
jgi:hypothetical protein